MTTVHCSKGEDEGFDGIIVTVAATVAPHCMHWIIGGRLHTYEAKPPVLAVSARGPPIFGLRPRSMMEDTMSRYTPPDDRRRLDRRKGLFFKEVRNEKLDFPPVKKGLPGWLHFIVNTAVNFFVNVASNIFGPAIVAFGVAAWAIVQHWINGGGHL